MEFLTYLPSLPALAYVPLLVVMSCSILHYLVYWRRTTQWRKSNIPFLPPSFLIGHKYFWDVINNSFLVSLDRIYKENKDKDVVGFFMATMPVVLVRNPALARQIFVRNFDKTFETGWAASRDAKITQHMLNMCADKGVWKSGRTALSPMFGTARVSGQQFAKITNQIQGMLAHAEQAQLRGRPISVKEISLNFIEDANSHSFFGLEANSYEKKGELLQLVESFFEPSLGRLLSAFAQTHFHGIQAFESLKFIGQRHIDSLKNLLQKQMTQRTRSNNNENDFVDFLLALKDQEDDGKLDKEMIVSNEMIGLGLSLLFARSDSTAFLASFAIHLLSLHPEHQARIRQEVGEAMQKHKTTEFTYEVVQDLHFLDQCLQETTRLYPSIPALTRMCAEDITVPGTDYTFKKGERVIVDPYSIHRDPKYFETPDEFNPDRFSPDNKGNIDPDTFLGFGIGPRKCPGHRVGFLLVSTMIGSLLHKYEVRPLSHVKQMDAYDFHPRSFTNVHKEDILIDLVPRQVAAF